MSEDEVNRIVADYVVVIGKTALPLTEAKKSHDTNVALAKQFRDNAGDIVKDLSEFGNHGLIENRNIRFLRNKEFIKDSPAPHRRYGTMECMYHDDEGIVDNQFQGDVEQTSKNEILYRKKMQKGEVDIDNSGLNSMKYEIHSIDTIYNRHKLINVRFGE